MKMTRILFLALLTAGLFSQTSEKFDEELKFHSHEIDRLRKDIEGFEKKIKQTSEKEKTSYQRVQELSQEISLIENMIYGLQKEEKGIGLKIKQLTRKRGESQDEYSSLQKRYAERVRKAYMKGHLTSLEVLFSSTSVREAAQRVEYFKLVSKYERTLAKEIQGVIGDLLFAQVHLEQNLNNLKKINREKSQYKASMEDKRKETNKELAKLKKDKQELEQTIDERKDAIRKLEIIIADLEKKKKDREEELKRKRMEEEARTAVADFTEMKGKLLWPIEGSIISTFGSHQHPQLKTVINNTGIDIRGKAGAEVSAVFDGIVTTVTYIRSFGNTVIIDHGNGYYTVYTHVTDVEVKENMYVKAREIIAHVGNSGSLDGAKLHFEIWGNRQKLDPELWLRKKG